MTPKVIWSGRAVIALEKVLQYLKSNWTENEVSRLELKITSLVQQLKNYPELFPASSKNPELCKAVVDKNNFIIYKWNSKENSIVIVVFRGTKQKHL